jgi:hypothetical protein
VETALGWDRCDLEFLGKPGWTGTGFRMTRTV